MTEDIFINGDITFKDGAICANGILSFNVANTTIAYKFTGQGSGTGYGLWVSAQSSVVTDRRLTIPVNPDLILTIWVR